jgi:hypothetical protein
MKIKDLTIISLVSIIGFISFGQAGHYGTVTAHNSRGSAPTLTFTAPNTCADVGNLKSGRIAVRNLSDATADNHHTSQSCFTIEKTSTDKNVWAQVTIQAGSGITGLYFYSSTSGVTPQPTSSTNLRTAVISIYNGTTCQPTLTCGAKWDNAITDIRVSAPHIRSASTERVDVSPGTTYRIEISTTTFSTDPNYNFDVYVVPLGAIPTNNNCSNAITFTDDIGVGCNLGAKRACNTNIPGCAFTLENSVFYTFTKPGDGIFSVTISNVQCEGGGNDLQTAIYRATPGNCNTNLNTTGNQIANRCFTGTYTYVINNSDPPGTQYILWVDGNAGAACSWGLTVLPVEWKRFDAFTKENNVLLEWTTSTEKNSDYFIIERSTDTENWMSLGRVIAAGNSSFEIDYQFIDPSPEIGINYYRLRQVDFDGTNNFSITEYVYYNGNKTVGLYPNPTNDFFILTGLNKNEIVTLFDYKGNFLENYLINDNFIIINLSLRNNGIYQIKTTKDFYRVTKI